LCHWNSHRERFRCRVAGFRQSAHRPVLRTRWVTRSNACIASSHGSRRSNTNWSRLQATHAKMGAEQHAIPSFDARANRAAGGFQYSQTWCQRSAGLPSDRRIKSIPEDRPGGREAVLLAILKLQARRNSLWVGDSSENMSSSPHANEVPRLGHLSRRSSAAVTGRPLPSLEMCPRQLEISFLYAAPRNPGLALRPGPAPYVAHGPNEYVDLRKVI